jgi:hypothetical protein
MKLTNNYIRTHHIRTKRSNSFIADYTCKSFGETSDPNKMGLVQLESASLEASSSGTSSKLLYTNSSGSSASASRSSYNFLDRIKRSSTKLNSEIKKRMPSEQLTFTSVTQSLSESSGEIAEVLSKQFSLFKTSSSGGEQEVKVDTRDDGVTEVFQSFGSSAFGTKLASPSHRTSLLLDVIGVNSHQTSSPLHSIASNSSESWDESTMGSREFSLLDTAVSGDTDGDTATYFDDGFGDMDTAQYFGEGESQETRFDEFGEEDGFSAMGGVLLQIGSCNFKEELQSLTFDEDDYSVVSDAFRTQRENINSMGQNIGTLGQQKKVGPTPTVQAGAPGKRGILDAMFSCHG